MANKKSPSPVDPQKIQRRALLWLGLFTGAGVTLFLGSSLDSARPAWLTPLEIGLIVVLVWLTVWLQARTTRAVSLDLLWRAYSIAALLPAIVIVGLWQYGALFNPDAFIPGLGWRLWLLLYTLPHLLQALAGAAQPPQK